MAYPVLMAELLPAGLLGLLFASLLAAFMSTVDTHINWGSSYLVNDIYRRFLRPEASERELVRVSRATVVALAALAVLIATRISSIEGAWRFFIALGAGLGLPAMLRWVWWRVNAWTEIVGMSVATTTAFLLYALVPEARDEYLLVVIVATSMTAAIAATFLTAPTPKPTLERFVERVRPPGWWGEHGGPDRRRAAWWLMGAWGIANVAVFALMFGVGWMVLGHPLRGAVLAVSGAACIPATLLCTRRSRHILSDPHEPVTGQFGMAEAARR
jgi:solute:Na+ symporter, SSS family